MFLKIEDAKLLKFNNCKDCVECCKNKYLAPLILDDFERVYNYFPILIAKLEVYRPMMLLSNKESCPYLENDRCGIYENRPPACVIYPFTPWFDDILLDTSCKGVGVEGELLPDSKEKFRESKFFDKRIDNITLKLQETFRWLEEKKLEPVLTIQSIELFKIVDIVDEFDKMHNLSLRFLRYYL